MTQPQLAIALACLFGGAFLFYLLYILHKSRVEEAYTQGRLEGWNKADAHFNGPTNRRTLAHPTPNRTLRTHE